ncbi:hypothetical protein TVAG_034680 [Trichomonas vaginalis G3]|uniref:Uncharacterized protein n=1 Tax=Trichomonas vaginalis (strain ATCC PRA-98 / G3) TaxID=412133 RepID=A2FJ78_TRIV3|nr:protein of unknown function, DUF563 family [Trichomonas vaginalis G3]EAX95039.1 hypothetical protein TVAG_034680 [Trichomonas vaginalis G3]KAI5537441.1 protein of unknown function, DUF563 family [Trichomonas vaginalis G3]|eukprot:XP_001307969.1 hypothetical protein [Trichomonas vaginalis G3]
MIDNKEHKRKSPKIKLPLKIFVYSVITLLSVLYLADGGAPLPPFSKRLDSMDCDGLKLLDFQQSPGLINASFLAKPSIEYPPEYLPNFINFKIKSSAVKMEYSGDQLFSISRDNHTLNVSFQYVIAGNSTISITCLKSYNYTFNTYLQEIPSNGKGLSRSNDPKDDMAEFEDVCSEKDTVSFFWPFLVEFEKINHDHKPIDVAVYDWLLQDFLKMKNLTTTTDPSILISGSPSKTWEKILFWLIPITNTVGTHNLNGKRIQFYSRSSMSTDDTIILQKISQTMPSDFENHCFSYLYISPTRQTTDIHKDPIYKLPSNFDQLRNTFVKYPHEIKTIVVHEDLYEIRDALFEEFPGKDIVLLRKEFNLLESASLMSKAQIYIGNHMSNIVYAAFMKPGGTLIDLSPKEYSCFMWTSDFVKSANISYIRVNNDGCTCDNYTCYPYSPIIEKIPSNLIADAIKKALSS